MSAAAGASTLGCLHQRLLEASVHGLDQQPGTLIAHAQPAACGRDRAGFADAFQNVGLAGADGDVLAKNNTQAGADLDFPAVSAPGTPGLRTGGPLRLSNVLRHDIPRRLGYS